jgi:hypothetical protein
MNIKGEKFRGKSLKKLVQKRPTIFRAVFCGTNLNLSIFWGSDINSSIFGLIYFLCKGVHVKFILPNLEDILKVL